MFVRKLCPARPSIALPSLHSLGRNSVPAGAILVCRPSSRELELISLCRTKHIPNLMGLSIPKALRYGYIASGYGVAAGIFALFFFGEVPKVRNDILSKLPVIGEYWVREIPPEDNPF